MSADREEITAVDAVAAVASGAYLIDVREQHEWDAGHAPQAHLLPMSELGERLDEVPDDREVLIVCHVGGRSFRVTQALRQRGFDAVDVLGGMLAWKDAQGELASENGAEPSVG